MANANFALYYLLNCELQQEINAQVAIHLKRDRNWNIAGAQLKYMEDAHSKGYLASNSFNFEH